MNENTHEIRYCRLNESYKLQNFIHDHWKNDHILSQNIDLLNYQHRNESEGRYNFVVANNKQSDEFDVILGFIPHEQYDNQDNSRNIWLAIWKKSEKKLPKGIGTKLLDFLEENYKPSSIGSIGINDQIEQLYLKRGWKSGVLDVWYFIRPSDLITFDEKEVDRSDFFENSHNKSDNYYRQRFDNHPFYNYATFNGVIYRKIETNKGNCLRIIDFKDKFYLDEFLITNLLREENADYIDCLNYGLSPLIFEKMGFRKRPDHMHIPQWFEPLDLGVKNIKFAFKSEDDYFIMKGDSDQDRPNQIL